MQNVEITIEHFESIRHVAKPIAKEAFKSYSMLIQVIFTRINTIKNIIKYNSHAPRYSFVLHFV